MGLEAGARLGPYEILAPIGAGGMGEVYKAKDTRLDRIVAVKILPEHLAESPERKKRFEREAKAISQLNHPHICTLYDVGSQDGTEFLVMEYIEGDTLAEKLKRGALPLDQALEYGTQIADCLDRAHRQGVVHRDLKPGNIMLTKSGVKLLDFGLAKLVAPEPTGDGSDVPTRQKDLTQAQAILGTLAYMAPEQLEAKSVDARTDLFAFGAVLYEMLTGRKAFEGESQASLISAIMSSEPKPVSVLRSMTPPALNHVVRTCLAKDPEDRWQAAGDVARQLKWIGSGETQLGPDRVENKRLAWAIPAAVAFVLGAIAVWTFMPSADPADPRRVSRSSIQLPPDQRIPGNVLSPVAISPRGERIAYVALRGGERRLFIRELDSYESNELDGTEGAEAPFFSPDGRWVGFFAHRSLYKVAVAGGSPVAIANAPFGVGGSWGSNDEIIYSAHTNSGLRRVSANGGETSILTTPEGGYNAHAWPQHLPGGKSVLFTLVGPQFGTAILSLTQRESRLVLAGDTGAQYVGRHLIFMRPGNPALMASSLDPVNLVPGQIHVPVLEGVNSPHASNRFSVSMSRTGSLVYVPAPQSSPGLVWVDRQGRRRPLEGSLLTKPSSVSVSPEGKYAAVRESQSIWVVDLERGTGTILAGKSPSEGRFQTPIWTTDGSRVTFSCNISDDWDICWAPRSGGETKVLIKRAGNQVPHSWSPNGELLFGEIHGSGADVWVMSPGGELSPAMATEANEATAEFSPDGHWVTYGSDETGRNEIYIRSYPEGNIFRRVSEQGGVAPRWSQDGDEIFYRSGIRLMAVPFETEPELRLGNPRVLFEEPYEQNAFVTLDEQPAYDVAHEGDRFLMVTDRSVGEIRLILNWDEELKRLVPRDN